GNIIPGLEKALAGRQAGDRLQVDVRPEEGYGVRNEGLVQDLPREAFQGVEKVEPGMQFEARTERGPLLVTVVEVAGDRVRIDGSHPHAGQTLHYDASVLDVREATEEEKQNGRAAARWPGFPRGSARVPRKPPRGPGSTRPASAESRHTQPSMSF